MNILIVGVGGQGTILTGRVLGEYARLQAQDVKVSEVHGMAQRGGCVVTHVRMGDRVLSPLIEPGTADAILAFETMEALRWLPMLKNEGLLIASTERIVPPSVSTGQAAYPEDAACIAPPDTIWVDARTIADSAGSARAANIVLLGVFAQAAGLDKEMILRSIMQCVKPAFQEMNEKAFVLGCEFANTMGR